MGWQSGDMSSGKEDGFPDGRAGCRQVVRENGYFPGRGLFGQHYSATGMSFTLWKVWYELELVVGTQIIVSDVRVLTM